MGSLFGKSKQKTTSQSQSQPWAPAQDNLKEILGDVSNWYGQAQDTGYISPTGDLGSIYNQYLQGLQGVGQSSQTQTQGLLDQAQGARETALQGYQSAASGGMNYGSGDVVQGAQGLIDNELLQSQIDAVNRGTQRNLTEQAFTGIDRNAVASGNAGSSRAGVAQAVAARSANEQMADTESTMRSQAYQNALSQSQNILNQGNQNILSGLSGVGSTSNQLQGAGAQYTGITQNALEPLLSAAQLQQTIQGANQADQIGQRDFLANLIGQYYQPINTSIAGLGGQTTGSQSAPTGSSTMDKIGSAAGTAAAAMALFSDPRLKKNIAFSHKGLNGHRYYTWEWNEEGKRLAGKDAPTMGVMAHEVKESKPEAVFEDASGYMKVDYSQI